jgi:RNA polymerase sigma-70 factor (ECF subfamily)
VRTCTVNTRNDILNYLIKTYWKPLFYYARRKGQREEDAKDLIQGFFLACIEHGFFARADRERARFRTFLRTSFDHYASNVRRAEMAKRRCPPGGIVSLDELMTTEEDKRPFEPRDDETPEDVFNRVWASDLLIRVLRIFREECRTTGKEKHCRIFELRIIEPNLEGATAPSLQDLAVQFGMSPKQAANCLLTARRAFQRLLREVIRTYAFSEDDVTTEMHELMRTFE